MSDVTERGPRTLPGQGVANRVVRGLLRVPGVASIVGRRLVTLYVVGRKTGRRYTIPVAYEPDGASLLVGTPFAWARNVRSGDELEIRLRGRRRRCDVEVYLAEADVVAAYTRMARSNATFASFNGIRRGPGGEPDPADVVAAWRGGARVLRLTVRPDSH
jgi:hypothetical protein